MKSTTLQELDSALNKAEKRFDKCWSYLVAIKKAKFGDADLTPLTAFQPLMASALFDLSRFHSVLSKERQERIKNKSQYASKWFARRLALIEREQQRLLEAVQIGRSIGDAYAWFFYQRDREFLRQHLQEPEQNVMSTGIGGIGELEAAKNIRMLGEHFVLHHCVTGILRLGDVTLIDLNEFKVAALGEIKSHSDTPGQVAISVVVMGDKPLRGLSRTKKADFSQATPNVVDQLSASAKARLQRQMGRIKKSHDVARKDPDAKLSLNSEGSLSGLSRLLESSKRHRFSMSRVGNSLLMFSYGLSSSSLANRLKKSTQSSDKEYWSRKIDALPDKVTDILVEGRNDNSAFVGSFYYNDEGCFAYLPGMTHPFWWPIRSALLKPVIFKRLIVGSIFNPAWLFKALEESGFEVDSSDAFLPKVSRQEGDLIFVADGWPFYYRAIQEYLMGEELIVSMLMTVFDSERTKANPQVTKVNMILHQMFGRSKDHET